MIQTKSSEEDELIALKREVNELKDFLDNGAMGLHWVGPDGTILWANRADYEPFGYTKDEYIGHNIAEFHADSDTINDILKRLTSGETLQSYEAKLKCKDGNIRHVLISSNVRFEDGKFIHTRCFTRDITERKELEQRKDDFIAMASHELKTPITTIKLFIQTLHKLSLEKGDKSTIKYFMKVDEQINRLNKLVSDLLDLSKLQGDKFELFKERFQLLPLLKETQDVMQYTTKKHKIVLEGKSNSYVLADKDRIGQVLINLLSNAIKYSPEQQNIKIMISEKRKEVIVSVQDFGLGIAKKHHGDIFNRFYRVMEKKEKTYPGLGIGLHITGEIIKRHNGRLWVESEIGKGSIFSFALPINNDTNYKKNE